MTVVRRQGALGAGVLSDALEDERERGCTGPMSLAVATRSSELLALRILNPPHRLGALVESVPRVVVDPDLPAGSWELRPVVEE